MYTGNLENINTLTLEQLKFLSQLKYGAHRTYQINYWWIILPSVGPISTRTSYASERTAWEGLYLHGK